jgi:hypothetical protein
MAPQNKGSYFNDPNEQRTWKVFKPAPALSTATLSTAAFVEALRIATRPVTTLSLESIYRNPGVDFRNMVLTPSIASGISTVSL